MSNKFLSICTVAILCITAQIQANTWYVDPAGSGDYTTIQAAVSAAASGDTIYLKAGQTFTGAGNYNISINSNFIFNRYDAGDDPIIDLNNQGRLFNIGTGYSVTIYNLVIKNGSSSGSGGAIYCGGTLNLYNCTFTANAAFSGGAIVSSTLNATNCMFNLNTATNDGGAVYAITLDITDCTFLDNNAVISGGAIYGIYGTVNCNRFAGNTAQYGSAIRRLTTTGSLDVSYNWWGTNDPDLGTLLYGETLISSPWITMSIEATNPASGPATITVNFTNNGTCTIPDTAITFTSTDGVVTPTQTMVVDGTVTASFLPTVGGALVCAQVDDEIECAYAGSLVVDLNGTYTNIQAAIDAAAYGQKIYIRAGQTFTGSGNFNIALNNKWLTFDRIGTGNDPIIDLNMQGRLFDLESGSYITINNLDIRNGYVSGLTGGAIIAVDSSLIANNCTFSNNETTLNGGAITSNYRSELTGCTFNNNSAGGSGGAVWCTGLIAIPITGCTFTNNSAGSFGGAVHAASATGCTISCSRFSGNSAPQGSAVSRAASATGVLTAAYNWWGSNDPIFGSLLYGSNITYDPWITMAIVASHTAIGETGVATVNFTKNGACTIPSSLIEFSMTDGIVTPTLSTVVDGSASASFVASSSSASVCAQVDAEEECANDLGPLIVDLYGTYTNIQAAVNDAISGDTICLTAGQTFTGEGNYNIDLQDKNLSFNRIGEGSNPVINLDYKGKLFKVESGGTVNISYLVIERGKVSGASEFGAVIENEGELTISDCIFRDSINENGEGGAISNSGSLSLSNCEFSDNFADSRGGAISNYTTLLISACSFYRNQALSGGAINLSTASQATVTGCTFDSNHANYYGGAIRTDSITNVSFTCNRFANNTADVLGSAIYNSQASYTPDFQNNWWGENQPTFSSLIYGLVDKDPWITMLLDSTHPQVGESATVTASFTKDGTCTIPDTLITFTSTDGMVTPTQIMVVDGIASASFEATNTIATVCAQIDNEVECTYAGPLIVDLYGTYTNIQDAINDAADGDTIYITAGQTFTGAGNRGIYLNNRIITFDRIGTGSDPIVDLESTDRLFYIQGSSLISINNMVIKNGKAADTGGAIYQNGGTLNATNCSFIDNEAPNSGGAFYSVSGNFNFTYCTFDGNSATGTFATGGAIYKGLGNLYSCIIRCSRFINNTAIYRGNAIESNGNITATNNWWGNNNPDFNSLIYMNYGTVTYDPWIQMSLSSSHPPIGDPAIVTASFTKDGTCTIPDVPITFTVTDGIVTPTQTMVIDGVATTTFITSNTMAELCAQVDDEEECIRYEGELIVDLYGTYTNIQAAVNAATGQETIYITAGQTFTGPGNYDVDLRGLNLRFDRYGEEGADPIIDLESHGRLFEIMSTQTINMSNLVVENGLVNDNGGAIKNSGFLTIANCAFDSNITETAAAYVPSNGGAIYSDGTLTVTTCIFRENISRATSVNGIAYGGAVYSDGDLTLSDCMFIGNYSDADTAAYGGALYTGDNCYAFGCTFSGSTALLGGAIINAGGSLTLTDCILSGNNADQNGGAISNSGPLDISGCTFNGNIAGLNGGVIYNGSSSNLTIGTCTFLGNSADTGGVIYNTNFATAVCSCSRFVHNTATFSGHAIAVDGGTVTATNNWWGTNTPATSLFYGTVTYDPWMVASIKTEPAIVAPGSTSLLLTDFTYNSSGQEITTCSIPATPVGFSTTDGSITSTLENTVDGIATTTLIAVYSGLSFTVSTTVGPDEENYPLTREIIPSPIISSLSLTKVALPIVVDHAEQSISYIYTVSNAGNVYLNDILLTDNKLIPTFNPPNPLNPGVVATGTATYTTLQSDIDAGSIVNDATVTGTTAAGESVTMNTTCTVEATQNPGISIVKKINNSSVSMQEPGVVVALDSTMDMSYLVTNIGNVTLIVTVSDPGYEITPSTTTLAPDESITCTAQKAAPSLNELHCNIGTAEGTTALSAVVTASASAYATSIPVNPYRFNFGCLCTDEGEEHILIGSRNMPSLDGNSLEFWTFDAAPTATAVLIGQLDLGNRIIMDSATYNTEDGMNIAVLTQTLAGDAEIVLVTYNETATLHSITPLSSRAFKAQWIVFPDHAPYIFTDAQDGMSLYAVDLNTYDLTLSSSVQNLGAGFSSAFLRCCPQSNGIYIIQGYNQTSIATYKVNLAGTLSNGVTTDLNSYFTAINSCATCYNYLVLGGSTGGLGSLIKYRVDASGHLNLLGSKNITDTTVVNYCERCCCGDDYLLVGTDNGLYSFKASDLSDGVTYLGSEWINTCWCCDMDGDYCIAVNSAHETYVFQQDESSLTLVLPLQ